MTIREVIEYLESFGFDSDYVDMEMHNIAIKFLEKQEPKKVIQDRVEGYESCRFECPTCGFCVTAYWKDEILVYCSNCGQKLDWEVEE